MPIHDAALVEAIRREMPEADGEGLVVVYDGQCPFCSAFSKYVAPRDRFGTVRQLDARGTPALVAAMRAAGHDLHRDFAVLCKGELYFGHDGARALCRLDLGSGLRARLLRLAFGREGRGARLYRALNIGRRGVLKLLGRARL